MASILFDYKHPNFKSKKFLDSPAATIKPAPENYHATSNHPEYIHKDKGNWILVKGCRMNCVIVLRNSSFEVLEARKLKGDLVVTGRTGNGEDGVYVHTSGFDHKHLKQKDKFSLFSNRLIAGIIGSS